MSPFKNINFGIVRVREYDGSDTRNNHERIIAKIVLRIKEHIFNSEIPFGAKIKIPLGDILPKNMNKFSDNV